MKQYVLDMKKMDLHVHLNGAIPSRTIIELCENLKIELPKGFNLSKDLQVLSEVNSLIEYFKPWGVFKKLPIGFESLNIMVKSAFENLTRDNINYVEFRNSPFYISHLNNISLEESLVWLIEVIKEQSFQYNIEGRLILSLTRHELEESHLNRLLQAIRTVNNENYIVGVDISGNEDVKVSNLIEDFFIRAKNDLGLGISIHAGETGNIKNIEWAINNCGAMRIGHGSAAIKSEKVLNLIKEKDVCLEICLISNLRTGYCSQIEHHPLRTFLEWEIPFVLCTDNPAVHGVSLTDEYLLFIDYYNRIDIINEMYNRCKKYSFLKGKC